MSERRELTRDWNNDDINYGLDDIGTLKPPITLGIVIGTYAAVPYIHLQLEARKRLYPKIPCLVHNDGCDGIHRLRDLCDKYDSDFEHNNYRRTHLSGDLTVFLGGLLWAQQQSLDLMLKVSRRWIFLKDWTRSLTDLAISSQYHTFGSYCTSNNFGFRTECLALNVKTWASNRFFTRATKRAKEGGYIFMENYMHCFAQQFDLDNNRIAEAYRQYLSPPDERSGYASWDFIGTSRHHRYDTHLWHEFASPEDYFNLSKQWELPYRVEDFYNPDRV